MRIIIAAAGKKHDDDEEREKPTERCDATMVPSITHR
jgi:hypothetical protein